MAVKFWESHAKEMRRARLLNAAATIYSSVLNGVPGMCRMCREWAVETALELEAEIDKKLSEELAPKTR